MILISNICRSRLCHFSSRSPTTTMSLPSSPKSERMSSSLSTLAPGASLQGAEQLRSLRTPQKHLLRMPTQAGRRDQFCGFLSHCFCIALKYFALLQYLLHNSNNFQTAPVSFALLQFLLRGGIIFCIAQIC